MTTLEDVEQWWGTAISRIEPGVIELRGRPIQELIGSTSLVSMIWLLIRGSLPSPPEAALLEAALVASVDHGPQAPSIAAARMAATCGVGLNTAMATGVGMLGDVHGGAVEQLVELLTEIRDDVAAGSDLDSATAGRVEAWRAKSRYIPGFGHRFHPVDPRTAPLLALVEAAAAKGVVRGDYVAIGRAVERALLRRTGKPIPMNIDGSTAVIFCELGFEPELGRGIFILTRAVGILAHAWEQTRQGGRIKGPMPKSIPFTYAGPALRHLDHDLGD